MSGKYLNLDNILITEFVGKNHGYIFGVSLLALCFIGACCITKVNLYLFFPLGLICLNVF